MKEIESHELAVRLNLAGNISGVLSAARREECVRYFLDRIQDIALINMLLLRALELSRQRVDPRYENPWDAAITVYMFLLNQNSFQMAKTVASAVDQTPRLWWARQYSDRLLKETLFKSNSGQLVHTSTFGGAGQPELLLTNKSSESFVEAGFTGITLQGVCFSATQVQLPSFTEIPWSPMGQVQKYNNKNEASLAQAA